MPTGVYVPYNYAQPNQGQTGAAAIDAIRANEQALEHAIVMGVFPGWSGVSEAPYDTPPRITFTNLALSSEKIKFEFTRTTGAITGIRAYYSSDSGSSYVLIKRCVITYDGSGNYVSHTWDNIDA